MVETTHRCPSPGEAVTPCCGRTPFELPLTDCLTLEAALVTCQPRPSAPQQIQRKRTKGWRMPACAIYVGRPSKWGNPFEVWKDGNQWVAEDLDMSGLHPVIVKVRVATVREARAIVTAAYRRAVVSRSGFFDVPTIEEIRAELAGHDLACYCPDGSPCHRGVLIEIANASPAVVRILHLYGSRRERADMLAVMSALIAEATSIVHHWRPWQALVPEDGPDVTPTPPLPVTRGKRWANLAVIGALMFVFGVVVYWSAVRP